MSLTKEDLSQIKSIINESLKEAIDMRIEPRFVSIDGRLDAHVRRFDEIITGVNQQFDIVIGQLYKLHEEVGIIKDYVLDHDYRITKLEKRLA